MTYVATYIEERAAQIDATTKPGDILIVDNGDEEIAAIIRDDTAERRGLAMPGEHWSNDPNDDPMRLHQHIQYAKVVHRLGEPISATLAPTLPRQMQITWINDDFAQITLDGQDLAISDVDYDELGTAGMREVIAATTRLAKVLGVEVVTIGTPGR